MSVERITFKKENCHKAKDAVDVHALVHVKGKKNLMLAIPLTMFPRDVIGREVLAPVALQYRSSSVFHFL